MKRAQQRYYDYLKRIVLRERLAGEQNWRCCYCGQEMTDDERLPTDATLEHVIPRSFDGVDLECNIVVACRSCNNKRSNLWWSIHYETLRVSTCGGDPRKIKIFLNGQTRCYSR